LNPEVNSQYMVQRQQINELKKEIEELKKK